MITCSPYNLHNGIIGKCTYNVLEYRNASLVHRSFFPIVCVHFNPFHSFISISSDRNKHRYSSNTRKMKRGEIRLYSRCSNKRVWY